jgi:hypothetical protein
MVKPRLPWGIWKESALALGVSTSRRLLICSPLAAGYRNV